MATHEDFTFDSSQCIYVYTDSAKKKVTLNWSSRRKSGEYELRIQSVGGTNGKAYSLYNLCLQNRNWGVHVTVKTGMNVQFFENDLTTPVQPIGGSYDIPETGKVSAGDPAPNENNIRYLSFDGDECVLLIESERKLVSPSMPWTSGALTSHDNIPDPPVSGAED